MIPADDPVNESLRLRELLALEVLDTEPDPRFDRIVQLAAEVMGTPVALISLIDRNRQWFKAKTGLDICETPRDIAFCSHAIHGDAPMIVLDAVEDHRFFDNPLVVTEPHIRFYAGAPLIMESGNRIGTLCAIDRTSRSPSERQIRTLQSLAAVVVDMLSMRREISELKSQIVPQHSLANERSLFIANFGHELRTPLNQILGFSGMIENETLGPAGIPKYREYGGLIRQGANHLYQMIDGIVRTEKAAYERGAIVETANIDQILDQVVKSFDGMVAGKNQQLIFRPCNRHILVQTDETALRQIAINLISNANKHCPAGTRIDVSVIASIENDSCQVEVRDDGPGIPDEVLENIGQPFLSSKENGDSIGLGLGITKQLAESMGCVMRWERGLSGGTRAILHTPVARRQHSNEVRSSNA